MPISPVVTFPIEVPTTDGDKIQGVINLENARTLAYDLKAALTQIDRATAKIQAAK
jgi:hypothetical protein